MRIINYVAKGQGIGARWLLLFSFILSIVFAVFVKIGANTLVPHAQDIADQLLPIRIENGIVVEPADTYKEINLGGTTGDQSFRIVVNTLEDDLDPSTLGQGFFITRTHLYGINNNQIRYTKLEGDLFLEKGDHTDLFKKVAFWAAVVMFPFAFIFVFIWCFILVLFYATVGLIWNIIFKKKFDFDFRMRLSTLAFLATYVVFFCLGFLGISSRWLFFFAVLALQALVCSKLAAPENAGKAEKPKKKTKG